MFPLVYKGLSNKAPIHQNPSKKEKKTKKEKLSKESNVFCSCLNL